MLMYLFYAGAIATLYGTIFAATASNSRVYSDMCRLLGFFERDDYAARVRYRNGFIIAITVVPATIIMFAQAPVRMVVIGATAQALMLPVIGLVAIYLRHRRLPNEIAPSPWVTAVLWLSTAVMFVTVGYGVFAPR